MAWSILGNRDGLSSSLLVGLLLAGPWGAPAVGQEPGPLGGDSLQISHHWNRSLLHPWGLQEGNSEGGYWGWSPLGSGDSVLPSRAISTLSELVQQALPWAPCSLVRPREEERLQPFLISSLHAIPHRLPPALPPPQIKSREWPIYPVPSHNSSREEMHKLITPNLGYLASH